MPNIDLDDEFLELFYNVTGYNPPSQVTLLDLKRQMINIIDLLRGLSSGQKKSNKHNVNDIANSILAEELEENNNPAILVVDDLGVITYQLRVLLSQFDYDVDCSQEIYDAVNKYKKRKYRYVVMDLFIPTEREGFILLAELKKMAAAAGETTTVGVITASPRKEIENQCKARGADFFLEKNNDWQNSLFNIMKSYIDTEKGGDKDEDNY